MHLQSLNIGRFKSYGSGASLDFAKLSVGLFLVAGTNGAGKSTLFDAVYWPLYGVTMRGLRASGIEPWAPGKGASVSLTFGDAPSVARTWGGKNTLRLGDKEVDQAKIEQAFGPPETARNVWYFGQSVGNSLFFLDLSPPDRMELYGQALDLELWSVKAKQAGDLAKTYAEDAATAETKVVRAQATLDTLESSDVKAQHEAWEQGRKKRLVDKAAETKAAEAAVKDIETKLETACAVAEKLSKADPAIARLEGALEAARTEQAEAAAAVQSLKTEQRGLVAKLETFDKLGPICDACGQPVDPAHKRKHLAAVRKEMDASAARYRKAQGGALTAEQATGAAHRALTAAKETAREALEQARSAAQAAGAALDNARGHLERCKRFYSTEQAAANPFADQLKRHGAQITAAKKELQAATAERDEAKATEGRFAYWSKGFRDIRLQVLQDSLAQLNAEVNETLHELGCVDWTMNFEVEQETKSGTVRRGFLCSVKSPHSPDGTLWEAWSGGESQRLRLGAQLGVSNFLSDRLGIGHTFELWDEPTKGLNDDGVKDLLNVLQERAQRYGRSILIAEHRALDFDFDGVVRVSKDANGVSRIEVEA